MLAEAKYAKRFRTIGLWPFALVYRIALMIRHALYDHGVLKTSRPLTPTIVIGNLALGGTGKTPMLELILRLLERKGAVATLSRGYGRKSRGIREVQVDSTAEQCGDEPLQVKRNFPRQRIFVGADRVKAIEHIQRIVPGLSAVVLDDALQHRRLRAGMNILLTTWQRPWCDDALFPAGTLRDLPERSSAADVVVVTKCPALPDAMEQRSWRERLGLRQDQPLFFSGLVYDHPATDTQVPLTKTNALLFTGIADPEPLVVHTTGLFQRLEHVVFADHHTFSSNDLHHLAERYDKFAPGPKTLVTTEKDAARLSASIAGSPIDGLPLMVIGVRAIILNEKERFVDLIHRHVGTHQADR